jgi:hypothetical protein
MSSRSIALALLPLLAAPVAAQPRAPFTVGAITAQPGSRASGSLVVAARAGDQGTTVPVTVINGKAPGPVLALIAGTHGYEYPPIIAAQRLRASIDPATLAGTLVIVHAANMPSLFGRTIYYSPVDGKNLNRVFPGKADGTLSERIAEVITREIIERATHVVDMHCGDGNEALRPYLYWVATGPVEVARASYDLALAAGFSHIVIDRERPTDAGNSVYLSNTAILRGKPALTIESGALGQSDEESTTRIVESMKGVMRHLGMRAEGPPPVAHPVWIDHNEVLRAGTTGLVQPLVERGTTVAQGTVLARIVDMFGDLVEEVRAPFDGEVLYVLGTPPVSKGEPVAFIGARADAPRRP